MLDFVFLDMLRILMQFLVIKESLLAIFMYICRCMFVELNQNYMKTLKIFFGFLFLIILSACTDDTSVFDMQGENGEFVTLKLNFGTQDSKEIVVSRASTEPEKKLYDLQFYIFNAQGRLTGYKEIYSEGESHTIPDEETVSIRTKSGESYIYAVGNINKSTTYYLDSLDLALLNIGEGISNEEYWDRVEASQLTREKFLSIQFKRLCGDENNLFSPDPAGNVFVMSGYINDGNKVTIPEGNNGIAVLPDGQNYVKLYRILSKITLSIRSNASNGTFTPKYYRLCNVPKGGGLVPKDSISTTSKYLANNITTAGVESSFRWNFDGNNNITFYHPENLQVAKENSSISNWKDREKNSWLNNKKTFTNAADSAAYIEIFGDYVNNAKTITASVNYTIHFGDFASSNTDFNLIRNYAYTYNVTVNGVNDIEVEAKTTTGEDNPHAEGMIVNTTTGEHFDIDAHYEARVLAFDKSTIQTLKNRGSGYILSIKTPFGETRETVNVKNNGVYRMGAQTPLCSLTDVDTLFTGEADYRWIKFVRNNSKNLTSGTDVSSSTCKYPGDSSESCLNIFQLLAQLYNDTTYTNNNKAYYTCFIDENYYANKSWPAFVNKDPRTMFVANELDVSADGKSLYAKVAYSISQRSISTFYKTDYCPKNDSVLVRAFGTETFDEEKECGKRLNNNNIGTFSSYQDWDARTSAVGTNENKYWSDNIVPVTRKQPLYSTAAKACMSRNRDLNGNDTIDAGEIRWYLAAVDQYRALFFGQKALNPDAYLIKRSDLVDIDSIFRKDKNTWGNSSDNGHGYRSKYHYFTCSGGNKTIFWAEEGLTNNPTASKDKEGWVSEAQLVRCIRTLQSYGDGLNNPELYYDYDNYVFELDGIKATRNYTDQPLSKHNEIDAENNLYSGFVVATKDLRVNNSETFSFANITGNDTDYCSNYKTQNTATSEEKKYSWRTPNQKEIALMVSESVLTDGNYATRTRFSGSDEDRGYWEWHDTPGFWTNTSQINVGGSGNTSANNLQLKIRCVRDK